MSLPASYMSEAGLACAASTWTFIAGSAHRALRPHSSGTGTPKVLRHVTPNLSIDVKPLSPGRLADFMAFFEGEAFSDNSKWSSCYCQCFYEDHSKVCWPERTGAANRECASRRISQGEMQGLLAYQAGKVVAWCNAAPRTLFHALDDEPIPTAESVGTILCFVVAPRLRGRGIATALLEAACQQLRDQGFRLVEANPRANARSDGENHFGPLSMYLAAGFTIRRSDDDGSVWVGKELSFTP